MGGQNDVWGEEFKAKYNDDFYTGSSVSIYEYVVAAVAKTAPKRVPAGAAE